MVDFLSGQPGHALFVDVLWQSALFLMAGLTTSLALHRRAARAHRVLLLAILGAVITPLGSQLVRREGWGLWSRAPREAPSVAMMATGTASISPSTELGPSLVMGPSHREASPSESTRGASLPVEGRVERPDSSRSRALASIPVLSVLVVIWGVLSGVCLLRLMVSTIVGKLVVSRAHLITQGPRLDDTAAASNHLGLTVRPDLLVTERAACPAIWCWGRRPVILLPNTAGDAPIDWVGVFCHELAHWVRRDHIASLIADILTCLIPWNPLAWWARRRLNQLSELACDDWAIASGREPVAYAETLLNLVPRRRMSNAMAAMSRRSGLAGRVAHILERDRTLEPGLGRRWSLVVGLLAIGLVPIIALAQAREGRMQANEMKKNGTAPKLSSAQPTPGGPAIPRVVQGMVRDVSGQPVAGAWIFAVGQRNDAKEVLLARASSDRDGKFSLDLAIDPAFLNLHVIAQAAGMALAGRNTSIRPDDRGQMPFEPLSEQSLEMTMSPNLPIEGKLLSPAGTPVVGASVSLSSIQVGSREKRDGFGLWPSSDEAGQTNATPFWPRPAVTDAQGRFRLDGFSEKAQAELSIVHADYVHESLTVSKKTELSSWHKQWNIRPVAPRFSHVLEPARPIEGVVTDQDTGKPIAGVAIEMAVSRAPEWRFQFHTTTDAQGRYRIMGIAWNRAQYLFTNINPPITSGYSHVQRHLEQWPAGVKDLRWDFTLKKRNLIPIRSKVIDGDTRQPIAGAHVSTGLTDAQGNFTFSTFPGTCLLFVEGPTLNFQRVTVPRSATDRYYTYYPHGFAKVEVPEQGTVVPLEIAIKKGATIAAQAVDPDDNPLPNVWVSGLSLYASGDRTGQTAGFYSNGLFRMSSFVPGQTYRIFFIQNDRNLAAFADLEARPDSTEPVKVVLRPTASVKGKLLKPDGSTDRGRRLSVHLPMNRVPVKHDTMDFLVLDQMLSYSVAGQRGRYDGARTNDQGEFEIRDLVPGVTNYLTPYISSNRTEYVPVEPLRPGEVRDLGAVKPTVMTDE